MEIFIIIYLLGAFFSYGRMIAVFASHGFIIDNADIAFISLYVIMSWIGFAGGIVSYVVFKERYFFKLRR